MGSFKVQIQLKFYNRQIRIPKSFTFALIPNM